MGSEMCIRDSCCAAAAIWAARLDECELLLRLLARVLLDSSLSSASFSRSLVLDPTPSDVILFHKVVDVIVQIRVCLPVMAPVAILLVQRFVSA